MPPVDLLQGLSFSNTPAPTENGVAKVGDCSLLKTLRNQSWCEYALADHDLFAKLRRSQVDVMKRSAPL